MLFTGHVGVESVPVHVARRLIGRERRVGANRHLGVALAFVAGAINAGGFLAVAQYTSHMTGIVSSMAHERVLGSYDLVLNGIGAWLSFLCGATTSAVRVSDARRRRMHSEYALPLLLSAFLLLCFGLLGARLAVIEGLFVPVTVMLLCFIMGLQNVVISKLSNAEMRTTHLAGILTDIGIALGKLCSWGGETQPTRPKVLASRDRLRMLSTLAGSFFIGGVAGALGFKRLRYGSTVWLALALVALAVVPAVDDRRRLIRRPWFSSSRGAQSRARSRARTAAVP